MREHIFDSLAAIIFLAVVMIIKQIMGYESTIIALLALIYWDMRGKKAN